MNDILTWADVDPDPDREPRALCFTGDDFEEMGGDEDAYDAMMMSMERNMLERADWNEGKALLFLDSDDPEDRARAADYALRALQLRSDAQTRGDEHEARRYPDDED